jgi:hypothetical protein
MEMLDTNSFFVKIHPYFCPSSETFRRDASGAGGSLWGAANRIRDAPEGVLGGKEK